MCGRYTLRSSPKAIAEAFGLAALPDLRPRYNIAPTQQVLTILLDHGKRQAQLRRWGLVPSWAKDPSIGYKLINARAGGVADKPSFRSAFKRGRCLVVADGFYEWKKIGKAKQPYFIRLKTEKPFAFAGLCEHWHRDDETIDSCSLITTEPNELMATIHDRMPAILPPEAYDARLDPEFEGKEKLPALLRPFPVDELTAYAVNSVVNNARNETPDCIAPV